MLIFILIYTEYLFSTQLAILPILIRTIRIITTGKRGLMLWGHLILILKIRFDSDNFA